MTRKNGLAVPPLRLLALFILAVPSAWAGVSVSWVAPANGTVYNARSDSIPNQIGDPVTLTATATATQGYTISKVEFFYGSTLIGVANSSPNYSYVWYPVPIGNYAIYAKATAVKGSNTQTATTVPVNVVMNAVPVVTPINPPGLADIRIGTTSVAVSATASDQDGSVAKVEFFDTDCADTSTLVATVTTPPYGFNWTVPQPYYDRSGSPILHCISIQATDDRGASNSVFALIYLVPGVSITSPANAATYTAPANIPLTAKLDPSDFGGVQTVRYYNGATLIGESTTPPYAITWQNVPAGNYSITAILADADDVPSAPINVTVTAAAAQVYFIEVDHLNTPRLVANAAGTTVWKWDQQEPFGESLPDQNPTDVGVFDLPLRFPGQYFDNEANLNYNLKRDYDANTGRYVEGDPIGSVLFRRMPFAKIGIPADAKLALSLYSIEPKYNHPYGYAKQSPLTYVDAQGLSANACMSDPLLSSSIQLVALSDELCVLQPGGDQPFGCIYNCKSGTVVFPKPAPLFRCPFFVRRSGRIL